MNETSTNSAPVEPPHMVTAAPAFSQQALLMPAAIVVAGALIAGAMMYNNAHPSQLAGNPGGGPAAPAVADITKVNLEGEPFIGNPDAKIVIAYWSDYQCPFCKRFEVETLPQIMQNYVNSGKAKVVFKDFPFLGQDSTAAAEYARAVWALYPDQYFVWRTAMFNAQDDEGDQGFGDVASINALNKTIPGLDAAKIAADVTKNKAAYDARIASNKSEAQSQGIGATPSFIVGKQMVQGALPYAQFKTAIDAAK